MNRCLSIGMLEWVFSWLDVLPAVNQLGLGKICWNLATSSVEVEFRLRTINFLKYLSTYPWTLPILRPAERGGQGGQMPRGPATFRGPVGPGRAHSQHCKLYFGSVTALYMRARDRSAQGPGFSLGGPAHSANQAVSCQHLHTLLKSAWFAAWMGNVQRYVDRLHIFISEQTSS